MNRRGPDHGPQQKNNSFHRFELTRAGGSGARARGLRFSREGKTKKKTQVVEQILERVEQKISEGEVKATLGDYIRLVQLHKELEEEEPGEITVRWVDPDKAVPEQQDGET